MADKKRNFLKTIASAFVEIQEENPSQVNEGSTNVTVQKQVQTPLVQIDEKGTIQAQIDNNLLQELSTVMEESNIPGPDYIELVKAANNDVMKSAIPDESARFMAAYISMKATAPQLNRNIVLGSIDKYIEILNGERTNGLAQLEELRNKNVTEKEKAIEEAQNEIADLQKRLQEKIKFVSEEKAVVANAKNEMAVKEANFNHTFDTYINKLKTDKEKLDKVLVD